jgi:hypothetical protein
MQRANELKSRRDQWETTLMAEHWKAKFRKDSDKQYSFLKCPFKLIYRLSEQKDGLNTYSLVRYEDRHIH